MQTKEEFLEQQKMEEKLMDAFFSKPPLDAHMGGKGDLINYIAETAVELFENTKEIKDKYERSHN